MPQPLSSVKSTDINIFWTAAVFDDRPKFSQLVASIIATSSAVDHELGTLLGHVIKSASGPALAIYRILQNQNLQKTALQAAASNGLPDDQHKVFSAATSAAYSAQKQRHCIAHWLWGFSNDLPDCILLTDQKYFGPFTLNFHFPEVGPTGDLGELFELDKSKVFVYTIDDFKQIKTDLIEAAWILQILQRYLRPAFSEEQAKQLNLDPAMPGTRAGALRQLSNSRLFREALVRFETQAKNNPQSQGG
jgi:hypothetical protein